MAVPITTMNKGNASQLGTHYSIIFQKLGGWDPKHICDFEQGFQRNTPNCSWAFYLAEEIQTLADLLGKGFLCITCLFAVVSDLQAKGDIFLRILGTHRSTSPTICYQVFPKIIIDGN